MSVNKTYNNNHKTKYDLFSNQQNIKLLQSRINQLQIRESKQSQTRDRQLNEQIQNIKTNLKLIANSSIENLKRLEESTQQNWQQIIDRMKSLQNKILWIFKQKQQTMQYLQCRVAYVESSQKHVTDFMKNVAEQQGQKYSGVSILQQKLKRIQKIFQLKDQKQTQSIRLLTQTFNAQINQKMRIIEQNNKQLLSKINTKLPQQRLQFKSQQFEELKNKLKIAEMQSKQQNRANMQLQQKIKQFENKFENILQSNTSLQKKLKEISKKPEIINQTKFNKYKTYNNQTNERQIDSQSQKNFQAQKKTIPSYLKQTPSAPSSHISKQSKQQLKKNSYNLPLQKSKNHIQQDYTSVHRNKKQLIKQEQDDDPFHNMGAGIRGLLRKSKQKQHKQDVKFDSKLNSKPALQRKPLPRQNRMTQLSSQSSPRDAFNRNLPPVKADLKRANQVQSINTQEQQEQQQVYQCDEYGYLMDQQGNYLQDEQGNRIHLSQLQEEQLEQY